jgi:predicted PurR-regulated permease PerM
MVLTGTVVGVVVVSCLYWAQTVFIPVALAIFLTFLLSPLVTALQRRRLGRVPSVCLVVVLAGTVLGGVGWAVTHQVLGLAEELPAYTENIKTKIKGLREIGGGRLGGMIKELTAEWQLEPAARKSDAPPAPPSAVVVHPESPVWARLPSALGAALESLGGLALALVLVLFMLLKREDLRNRLLRLVGSGRLTVSTKAVEEAGERISRFLLMQLILNTTFGVLLAGGLLLIGVDYALLWGFLAGVLRYVPYLGIWVAATPPFILSLAMSEGWLPPLLLLGLFLTLELIINSVMEPWLFGKSMGVSEVAMLICAAFWAFLWGPIGLVLSSPLTVCLAVLGRYVPYLGFLDVLLGDEPALDSQVGYYQRLLARDQDEATALVLARVKAVPPERIYDDVLVPALYYAKKDRERDDLTEADEEFILRATREIVEDLGERQVAAAATLPLSADPAAPLPRKVRVLGCPGHGDTDRLALEMLCQLLDPARWDMEILSTDMLSAELIALAGEKDPAVVCLAAIPPGGLAHTRYLCKRLRARMPAAKIVVGRWGLQENAEQNQEQLREAGADAVETTLLETREHLDSWLPVLAQAPVKVAG